MLLKCLLCAKHLVSANCAVVEGPADTQQSVQISLLLLSSYCGPGAACSRCRESEGLSG